MVPVAFRREVSPVTSEMSLQFQSVYGNCALRDMAHVLIRPINAGVPHCRVLLGVLRSPRHVVALYCGAHGAAFSDRFTPESPETEGTSFLNGRTGRGLKTFRLSLIS